VVMRAPSLVTFGAKVSNDAQSNSGYQGDKAESADAEPKAHGLFATTEDVCGDTQIARASSEERQDASGDEKVLGGGASHAVTLVSWSVELRRIVTLSSRMEG
jgi:hypothetical protein